jgi:hypothetical protein
MSTSSTQPVAAEVIDVKRAVRLAADYLQDLFGRKQISDLTLEEVELADDDLWHITMSFEWTSPGKKRGPFGARGNPPREYKAVRIDAKTSTVKSVKIRS